VSFPALFLWSPALNPPAGQLSHPKSSRWLGTEAVVVVDEEEDEASEEVDEVVVEVSDQELTPWAVVVEVEDTPADGRSVLY
jgi:hypothetical protein